MRFKYSAIVGSWLLFLGCTSAEQPPENSCVLSAQPTCFAATANHICDDSNTLPAVCSGTTWSCPAGSLTRESCRCGVPPDGNCLKDAGTTDDGSSCGGNAPLCYTLGQDGRCNDRVDQAATCSQGAWQCPTGTVTVDKCQCGAAPYLPCDSGKDALPSCDGSITPCYKQYPNGLCDDSQGTYTECTWDGLKCPAGTIPESACPCGVPPTGDCLKEGGKDAILCDATPFPCYSQYPNGLCNDVGGTISVCTAEGYKCPAGSVPASQCPCGVPPTIDCLKDGGAKDVLPSCDAVALLCYRRCPNGACSNVDVEFAQCTWDGLRCPAGTFSVWDCGGAPPTGGCLEDGGPDAPIPCDASAVPCLLQAPNGTCSDVVDKWAECTDQGIQCPPGYALEKDCLCGVPPSGDCLRDASKGD